MRSRFLAVLVAGAALALPAAAQAPKDPVKPVFVLQAQPIGKILDDVKLVVKSVAGDEPVKQMQESIEEALGEKGFAGVDLLRPLGGYMLLKGQITGPQDISGVVIVPVTGEKEFVDFLTRLKMEVEPVKGQAGLYAVIPPTGEAAFEIRMRVVDRHAHVGINVPAEDLAADKLVKPGDVIDPAERGLFALTSHLARVPKEYVDQQKEQYEQVVGMFENLPLPEKAREAMGKLMKTASAMNEQMYTEGDVSVVRLVFDRATNDVAYELSLTAKKGTALEKQIAGRKPTANRFAGLVTEKSAAGVVVQAPLFSKELNDAAGAGVEALADLVRENDPPPQEYAALFDAAMAGAARTLKSGDLDLAAALDGPDKDGLFGVVAAVTFDDPAKVEQELRALHKNAPEGVQGLIKLDAAKVGNVSIHQAQVGAFLPPEPQKVFGENASVCVAFAPKGVYVAFGPAAMDAIKAALAAKPGETRAFDLRANAAKLQKLVAAIDPNAGQKFAQAIGTEDKLASAVYMEVTGGKELNVRMGMNLKTLLPAFMLTGTGSNREFQAVPRVKQ